MGNSIFEEELIELENEQLFYGHNYHENDNDDEGEDWDSQVQSNASRPNYIWHLDSFK